jgi:hypothetical protein
MDNYLSPQASVGNPRQSLSATTSLSSITSSSSSGSPQKNFTARFQRKRTPTDELTEFWNLPQEDFDTCNPLRWWHGRRAQFPQLYRLVRDIFSIPGNYLYLSTSFLIIKLIYHLSLGSAVAVERIFSGGRDTISLRRASLKPETIWILMLVKRKFWRIGGLEIRNVPIWMTKVRKPEPLSSNYVSSDLMCSPKRVREVRTYLPVDALVVVSKSDIMDKTDSYIFTYPKTRSRTHRDWRRVYPCRHIPYPRRTLSSDQHQQGSR